MKYGLLFAGGESASRAKTNLNVSKPLPASASRSRPNRAVVQENERSHDACDNDNTDRRVTRRGLNELVQRHNTNMRRASNDIATQRDVNSNQQNGGNHQRTRTAQQLDSAKRSSRLPAGRARAMLCSKLGFFSCLLCIWLQSRYLDPAHFELVTENDIDDGGARPLKLAPAQELPPMTRPTSLQQIWVQLTFSTEFDQKLMPHTLHHYISTLGVHPSQILVALHHTNRKDPAVEETKKKLKREFSVKHFSTWFGEYTSDGLWEVRGRHRKKANVSDCDWVVRSDADELPAIPGNDLSRFLESVGSSGYDAVFGTFNDRVAEGGQILNITAEPTISEQFPLSCKITEMVAFAYTLKVIAFRGYHRENRGGHGLLDSSSTQRTFDHRTDTGTSHCGYPKLLRIDHFKWTFGVVAKLEKRYEKYLKEKMHFRESKRLLAHLQNYNGRLGIKELGCHQVPDAFGGNGTYSEGMACNKLPVTCPSW